MPLTVKLYPSSPFYRIRGTVCGVRVDESSKLASKRDAQKAADRITGEIQQRHAVGPQAPAKVALTFAGAVGRYMTDPLKPIKDRRFLLTLVDHFGEISIDKIDQAALDGFIREHYPTAAPATIQRQAITPLRAVLRHAGLNPIFRQPTLRPTRLRYLTPAEVAALVGAAAPHLKPLIIFCVHTGARMGEALALDWSNVDLVARRVTFVDTKNGETRGVPLNDEVVAALRDMIYPTAIRRAGNGKPVMTSSHKGRVFRTHTGADYPIHDHAGGQIKTAWLAACRRAGVSGATPHTMRHTFASWLVMRGATISAVGELLGHKSPAMTARYAHLSPDHLADAVKLLVPDRVSEIKLKVVE